MQKKNNFKNILLNKIKKKDIKVGIIGLGYVGLPLSIHYALKKINTFGFDIDTNKIKSINKGKSYIKQINDDVIKKTKKHLTVSSDFTLIKKCDVIVICLPTPLKKKFIPNLEYISKTIDVIKKYLRVGQMISLESTSYPGTTEDLIYKKLYKKFNIGKNLFICFSPEREDPGNKRYKNINVPKIVSGITPNCLKIAKSFYSLVFKSIVPVTSTKTAEFTKLLENIYRSVNIGLVNEMKVIAKLMNINIHEVIRAASTKPFGFKAFYPGPGMGGHCIPIDPFYMSWKSKQLGYTPKFIENAGKINSMMPKWTVNQILDNFKSSKIKLTNQKILIIGVAYKKNIDDTRESPALEIMNILKNKNINFDYHDPYIKILQSFRKYSFKKKSIILNKANLKKYIATIIVTDHDTINYKNILSHSNKVFDCRGTLDYLVNKTKIINL